MALQASGQMSFADVYNEITGESLQNPPISITIAELGQLQNISGQTIPLNQNSPYKPDGILPTVFPDEWYRYCQTCGQPKPFLQITKQAATSANAGEFFNYFLTVTNNGETSTQGNIFIYDTIPNNIIISSVTGSDMTYTVTNQNVVITYTGGLGVGQSASFYIIVKTFNSGTYYNQASTNGGGDQTIRFSNTTATTVATATFTATVTERRDRTLQRNDCGEFGTGSFVQVWSPYFTTTYTSFISQQDAEIQATNESVRLANNWLDANAQAVANQMGTCGFQYPTGELTLFGQSTSSRGRNFNMTVRVRVNTAYTTSTVTINLPLPNGIIYKDVFNVPPGWFINRTDNNITMFRNASFEPGYDQGIGFILSSTATGTFNFNAVMSGGGFAAQINSNTFTHTVTQPAIYDLDAFAENFDFTYGGNGLNLPVPGEGDIYAVPTDRAYYTAVLTISNGATATDNFNFLAYLPAHYPGLEIKCILDSTYWQFAYSAPAGAVQITAKGSVPIGQYYFRFYIDMEIDYYLASAENNPSELRVKNTFQAVNFIQSAAFYFTPPQNLFQIQKIAYIRWSNNYAVQLNYQFTRIPNNPNGLTLVTRNYRTSTDIVKSFNGLANTSSNFLTSIYYLDPARGNGEVEPSYGGAFYLYYINSGFPNYQNVQYFTLEIKTDLYQNGQEIVQNSGRGGSFTATIESLIPNPKLKFGVVRIEVNADGTYVFGNV
jgi:hypothetical protein